ncbi:MAG: tetratricopeptide repeat protein [bacterium]|nr:tetratricopeptide repeat protein [bacterium]
MRKHNQQGDAFCDSVATYMDSLLRKRDFAGSIQYFDSNRQLVDEVGGSWAGAMLHRVAQAYASLTNYKAALKAARTAQALAGAEGDSLLLAEIFVTLGGILRDSNELVEAQKAFRDAESIFRRNDCLEGQSRALNQLAGLHFRQTDFRNALTVLMDAVGIARRLKDDRKLAFMMGNIGRLQTFMGDFVEAEKHLQINVDLSEQNGDQLEIARARLSLGYVYIQQADFDQAERELEQAYPLITALNARREEVIYLTYLGELQYRAGRHDLSQKTLETALAMAEEAASGSSLAGRVMRHLAELHVRREDFRLARKFAARATVIMNEINDKVELGALTKIQAQVAASENQPAKARKLFRKAIDLLDESGVRWEKVEALVKAGESDAFAERQRMTYLFRAEEFYARSRIKSRQEDVSRIISDLGTFNPSGQGVPVASASSPKNDYLTACAEIKRIKKQLPMLARADIPILITGETGVGKDHLTRYFHALARPDKPYVAINCASVPETLLESELFGYRRGAFTGADGNKMGLFETANGGVLLLDEIGDMPLSLQAKLLGVLERRKVMPLGGTSEVDIEVLLVAATNRNLEEMVELGTFRRDLYYRLSGITLHLPALRERKQDIPLLLEHLMRKRKLLAEGKQLPSELVRQFIEYDWPGNIRELDNRVKRLEVMAQMVAEGDLVEVARSIFGGDNPEIETANLFERVEQFERQLITEALLAAHGNKSQAARLLGVHEATVRTKLKRYETQPEGEELRRLHLKGGAPG